MKKTLYILTLIVVLGMALSSCAIDKKCPAYSKTDVPSIEKNA